MTENRQTNNQYLNMTNAPVENLLKLSGPTIVSIFVAALYVLPDLFFAGQISTESTAAVGVVFALISLIQSVGFLFGQGSGIFLARLLGMQNSKVAEQTVATGFFFSLFAGVVMSVLGLCNIEPLARLLGATEEIISLSCEYLFYILIAVPLVVGAWTMHNQLISQGYSKYSNIGICVGGILNIALDPVFIFNLDMGVGGAALATVISQGVCFIILLIMVEKKGIKIKIHNICMEKSVLFGIFSGGLPALAKEGGTGIGMIFLNNIAGFYGVAVLAAVSIVTKLISLAGSVMIKYGDSFQPVCGYNYGAGLHSRVKTAYFVCLKKTFLYLIVAAVIMAIFAPQLIAVFRNDPDVIETGTALMRFQCISFVFSGFIVLTGVLSQVTGRTGRSILFLLCRPLIFFVPCLLILNSCLGILGLELSQMFADILTVVFAISVVKSIFREFDREIKSGTAE